MKKLLLNIFFVSIALQNKTTNALLGDSGILGGEGGVNGAGEIEAERIREGDLHLDDIPKILKGMIDIFMSLAGTIAVIFVIIGAYQIAFGSLQSDKSKGKNTIILALSGFALASLSWFIIKFILNNFA